MEQTWFMSKEVMYVFVIIESACLRLVILVGTCTSSRSTVPGAEPITFG